MGNINPKCQWPSCSCDTENGGPCRFEDPDYYTIKARNSVSTAVVVSVLTEDQRKKVLRYVKALEDNATTAEVTAAHFRPEFEACWERDGVGGVGGSLDMERARQIKDLVLDGPARAKHDREVAAAIRLLLGEG